jgi:TonB-dependent receptor
MKTPPATTIATPATIATPTTASAPPRRPASATLPLLLISSLLISALQPFSPSALSADAPASAAAVVTGRVLNAATDMWLKNAEVRIAGADIPVYTEDDGFYSITVPAGAVTLTASYASVQTGTASINATPGAANVLNFELQPIILDAASAAPGAIVQLDRFVVTAEREGQARAIMDQRAAVNALTIIATDNFGDVNLGDIAEVVKFLPGITVATGEDGDAAGVSIGALDAKYTTVAQDGVALTTNGRSVNLSALSVTGIESIEFAHTRTASMDAGSAAGSLNLKTKDPFSRRRAQFRFQFGLDAHSRALALGGSYMPDDRKHDTVFLNGQINYGNLFFNRRLAVEMNLSRHGSYSFTQAQAVSYSYVNPDPVLNPGIDFASTPPVLTGLSWVSNPRIRETYAGNLNLGYKLTSALRLSLRIGFKIEQNETFSHSHTLRARYSSGNITHNPIAAIQPESTPTHWVTRATYDARTGSNPRLVTGYNHEFHNGDTKFVIPGLTYKKGSFKIDLYGGYSRYFGRRRDTDKGFFANSNAYLGDLSWTADRPSSSSPAWTITQTGGDPWSLPDNWSKHYVHSNNIRAYSIRNDNDQFSGALDIDYARAIFGLPVTFKLGGAIRSTGYDYRTSDYRYTYLGPTGRPQEASIPYTQNYVFSFPLAGNISDQNWRVDDTYAIYRIFQAHPEYFSPRTLDNLRSDLISHRSLNERMTAAYFDLNTRVKRFRINAGIRGERTDLEAQFVRSRSNADVAAAGYNVSTAEGVSYKYYHGERITRGNDYSNLFLSGGVKYDFSTNFEAQLSASQSIHRPDYANLTGVVSYDETRERVTIPNNQLKPENLTKYYAALRYYFKPAGTLSLSAYRLDIRNLQMRNIEITKAEAERIVGYPLGDSGEDAGEDADPDAGASDSDADETTAGQRFYTTINSPNFLSFYGVTLEYNQQLTFLPGALRGLSVFSSFTWGDVAGAQRSRERVNSVKYSASGGLRYRFGRVNLTLRGTWQDDVLASVTEPTLGYYYFPGDHTYRKARLTVDLSGGIKLNKYYDLTFSVRNLLDAPVIQYSNDPDRMSRYAVTGAIMNISLKGTY